MKVKELIKILNTQDPELLVIVNGYESGYTDIKKTEVVQIFEQPNHNWWDGKYVDSHTIGEKALALFR
jgi:hypothetical protein